MKKLLFTFIAFLISQNGFCQSPANQSSPNSAQSEAKFIALIRYPKENLDGFVIKNTPKWNLNELMLYIPAEGVDVVDINEGRSGHLSHDEILMSLSKRKGKSFERFAHISSIISMKWGKNKITQKNNGLSEIQAGQGGGDYKLTFQRKPDSLFLIKIEYLTREGG